MADSRRASALIAAVNAVQAVYQDAIWLVWYERGVWQESRAASGELNELENILKECYDVIDLVMLAAFERFGDDFETQDAKSIETIRSAMHDLDQQLLGPVQRGPSQRQFRKGSLKPTSHLMRLARRSCQRVVHVLEDVNEEMLKTRAPRLARRRSSSWVPTSQEAAKAFRTHPPSLRRTSSVHVETGSMASRFSDAPSSGKRFSNASSLSRSSHVSLAKRYSKRANRHNSLLYTDAINISVGTPRNPQLSIQIQRTGDGPLRCLVDVPENSAPFERQTPIYSAGRQPVTVFHDPFASRTGQANVNITINLRDEPRASSRSQASSSPYQRRVSRSVPTSPTSSFHVAHFKDPRTDSLSGRTRNSLAKHKRHLTNSDHVDFNMPSMHRASTTPQTYAENLVSPSALDPLSPGSQLSPSTRSARTPSVTLSPAFANEFDPQISNQPGDTASIMTTSSLGNSIMSYMRHDSNRASHSVSLHATVDGPVPDFLSMRSASIRDSVVSSLSSGNVTRIDEASAVSSPSAEQPQWTMVRRRQSSTNTVTSGSSVVTATWRRSSFTDHRHRRHSTGITGITSPMRTPYAAAFSPMVCPPPASDPSDSSDGGVRLSMLDAAKELGERDGIPVPSPWNDYLGFCPGAFRAQAGIGDALVPRLSGSSMYYKCSNHQCNFRSEDDEEGQNDAGVLEAHGVRMRPAFLVKSHCPDALPSSGGANSALLRCLLCVLQRRTTTPVRGANALAAHLAEHRDERLEGDVAARARCVTGRRAADEELFDVNLLPLTAAEVDALTESLLTPVASAQEQQHHPDAFEQAGRTTILATVNQLRHSGHSHELFFPI